MFMVHWPRHCASFSPARINLGNVIFSLSWRESWERLAKLNYLSLIIELEGAELEFKLNITLNCTKQFFRLVQIILTAGHCPMSVCETRSVSGDPVWSWLVPGSNCRESQHWRPAADHRTMPILSLLQSKRWSQQYPAFIACFMHARNYLAPGVEHA